MTWQPPVYLAGPIEHAADRGRGWRNRLKQRDEFRWVDPFDKLDAATDEWTDERIVEEDLHMIDSSQGLLVHWENVPTCGTPMEIRYAHQRGMPVVVQTTVPPDDISPWLSYHATDIVETFDEAIDVLEHALWVDR